MTMNLTGMSSLTEEYQEEHPGQWARKSEIWVVRQHAWVPGERSAWTAISTGALGVVEKVWQEGAPNHPSGRWTASS